MISHSFLDCIVSSLLHYLFLLRQHKGLAPVRAPLWRTLEQHRLLEAWVASFHYRHWAPSSAPADFLSVGSTCYFSSHLLHQLLNYDTHQLPENMLPAASATSRKSISAHQVFLPSASHQLPDLSPFFPFLLPLIRSSSTPICTTAVASCLGPASLLTPPYESTLLRE